MNSLVVSLAALAELDPKDREVWYDKRVLGIGERQQGRDHGCSAARVYYRIRRADRRLQQYLGDAA